MRVIVLEEDRMWEFSEAQWRFFVQVVLATFSVPNKPSYPPELMLRSGTPTARAVADIANKQDARFVAYPSEWQRYRWEMELQEAGA